VEADDGETARCTAVKGPIDADMVCDIFEREPKA
jgi:hypothetical protein